MHGGTPGALTRDEEHVPITKLLRVRQRSRPGASTIPRTVTDGGWIPYQQWNGRCSFPPVDDLSPR